MKKIALLLIFAIVGVLTWYFFVTKPKPDDEAPKQQAQVLPVSHHSAAFNNSVNGVLSAYYALSDALVQWDSALVNTNAAALNARLTEFNLDEVKKDSLVYRTAQPHVETARKSAAAVAAAADLTAKRRAFHALTQNMYDLLRSVRYDAAQVYLQECPMAFNDDETAQWLSGSADIRNPYLGLHHPKYKGGMLECGETKDSLFIKKTNN